MTGSTKIPITAIVMTKNEKVNLEACLASVASKVERIVIVDSYSTDETLEIARKYTDQILQNPWVNYAKQFNWSLANAPIETEWVLRLDADERWTEQGLQQLERLIRNDACDGIYVRMKIYFMDRWLRFGGYYPNLFLRAFKKSKGTLEDRWMDEHIEINGTTLTTKIDVIEANYDRLRNLTLWTTKHNGYSSREAVEILMQRHNLAKLPTVGRILGNSTERKRWLKENLYFRFPLFIRPFFYFCYRFFFQLGFLDGKPGFVFHLLHAFWYRFLIDAKVYQTERTSQLENLSIQDVIKRDLGIEI